MVFGGDLWLLTWNTDITQDVYNLWNAEDVNFPYIMANGTVLIIHFIDTMYFLNGRKEHTNKTNG